MKEQFKEFADRITLTESQEDDAKTKYTGVCKKLHSHYYETVYEGKTKFLFGSYKTKTNVRPLTKDQDVDVIFKIPQETYVRFCNYKGNGPATLLQEVREILKEKYTTTEKISAWGKVVLVEFADNTHNIEVMPAYEEDDFTFTIPNSEDGGSWDPFDPRQQLEDFRISNNETSGLTAELTRMMKKWVNNTKTLSYKSYSLLNDVIDFLEKDYTNGATYSEYSNVCCSFLQYINTLYDDTYIQTAVHRSVKACDYETKDKPKEASEEWRKIFGTDFPSVKENHISKNSPRIITNPSAPYARNS